MSSLIISRIGLCQRTVIGNASRLGLLQTRLSRGPLNAAFRAGLAQPYSTDKQASNIANEISQEKIQPVVPGASTAEEKPKKPRSPLVNFYATFTVPIIKVLAVVAVTFYTLSFVKYYLAHSLEEEKKEV